MYYYTPVVHVSYAKVMNLGLNYLKKLQGSKNTFELALWRIKQTPHFTCPRQALEGTFFFLYLLLQDNLTALFFKTQYLPIWWNGNNTGSLRIIRWGHLQKGFHGVVSLGLKIKTWIPASCAQILIQHSESCMRGSHQFKFYMTHADKDVYNFLFSKNYNRLELPPWAIVSSSSLETF